MKAKKYILFLILFAFSMVTPGQTLVKVWETPDFKTPESVLYNHELGVIFVSNINKAPKAKDGNGFISMVNIDGTIKNFKWVEGLNAPKGMAIYNDKLYVSDIDELVEIDILKAVITKKYHIKGATFLNDVAVCKNGTVFVSDSDQKKIHALKDGELQLWLDVPDMGRINGLYTEDEYLFIGSDRIFKATILTREYEEIQADCYGIDGLEKDNDGNFIFSNWVGRIFYLKDGKMIKLLDNIKEKVNTADIDFASELGLLLVPTFFKNQVIAYRIEK